MPIILTLEKLRLGDCFEFKVNLGRIGVPDQGGLIQWPTFLARLLPFHPHTQTLLYLSLYKPFCIYLYLHINNLSQVSFFPLPLTTLWSMERHESGWAPAILIESEMFSLPKVRELSLDLPVKFEVQSLDYQCVSRGPRGWGVHWSVWVNLLLRLPGI